MLQYRCAATAKPCRFRPSHHSSEFLRLLWWLALIAVLATAACTRPDTEEQPVPVLNIDMSKPVTDQPDLGWFRVGDDQRLSGLNIIEEPRQVHLRLPGGQEFVMPSRLTSMMQDDDRLTFVDVAPLPKAEDTFAAATEKLLQLVQSLDLGDADDLAALAVLEQELPKKLDPYFRPVPVGHRIMVGSTSVLIRMRATGDNPKRWYYTFTFEPREAKDTADSLRAVPGRNAQ